MTTLADRIRSARRQAQYTRQNVARGVGVSASAVGQWEHPAGTTPSPEHMIALAGFLDVSLDWLVFGRIAGGGGACSRGGRTDAFRARRLRRAHARIVSQCRRGIALGGPRDACREMREKGTGKGEKGAEVIKPVARGQV